MHIHEKIDYLEIPSKDLKITKQFFSTAFGWEFEDFGTDYCAFSSQGIDGGFYTADLTLSTAHGCVLIVFYSRSLIETQRKILKAGGKIIKPIFSFPGGKRFHFAEPNGNEYAVWSDVSE